jgi:hydroxyacylglutathione hydrolase
MHVIGAGAELAYEHRPVRHGDSFEVGALRFIVLETPGHTPEHVAYAVADTSRAGEPLLLFTGGSLLVGAVGRTDLLGAENAVPFAHAMFHSIRDVILPHEDFVGVYPTHGAGSLCSTGIASTPWSTIGFERRYNPMVQPADIDEFARLILQDQPAFPRYFARMRPTNQAGPRLLGGRPPEPRALAVEDVRTALAGDAVLVDLRSPAAHSIAHIPGAVSIPSGSSFGTWLGWVVDPDRPLVLLLDDAADWDDAARQAMRVGYENLVGHLRGGFEAWSAGGGEIEAGGRLTVDQLASRLEGAGSEGGEAPLVIDVRQVAEYASGHVPDSVHIGAGALQDRLGSLPRDRPIATICASGYRASVAASLLRTAGFKDVSWVADGLPTWQARGHPVERGSRG